MVNRIKQLHEAAQKAREKWASAMKDAVPIGSVVDAYVGGTVIRVRVGSYGTTRHREGEVVGVNTKTGASRKFDFTQIIGHPFSEYDRFGYTGIANAQRDSERATQAAKQGEQP